MIPDWSNIDARKSRQQIKYNSSYVPRRKNKNYINSKGRLVNTKQYAIAWGIINKPYSMLQLKNKCKKDPDAPSFSFIVKRGWKGYPRYYNALVRAGMQLQTSEK